MTHMTSSVLKIIGLSVLALAVSIPAALAQAQQPPAGNAAAGKRLYMADGCYACHGTRGAGSIVYGPKVAQAGISFEIIQAQLRDPADRMPPYRRAVISDAQIADIAAFLQTIPAGRTADQIPLLNPSAANNR
jgi:mono/diheme cytochrome c family protein